MKKVFDHEIKIGYVFLRGTYVLGLILLLAIILLSIVWAFIGDNLLDFGSFIAAGRAAAAGNNPYQYDLPLVFYVSLPELNEASYCPNLNPPISLYPMMLLKSIQPKVALFAWRLVSLFLFIIALSILLIRYPNKITFPFIIWSLSLAGLWNSVQLGQIYTPILLVAVIAWILLSKNKKVASGLFIGLVIAFKPTFLFWALLLAMIGSIQAALTALITAGILSLIPVFSFGPEIYLHWIEAIQEFDGVNFPGNNSFTSLTGRFGAPILGEFVSVLMVFLIIIVIWKSKPNSIITSGLSIIASLLASPLLWAGYTIFLIPVFCERKWTPLTYLAAGVLSIPRLIIIITSSQSVLLYKFMGPIYVFSILFLLLDIILEIFPRIPKHKEVMSEAS